MLSFSIPKIDEITTRKIFEMESRLADNFIDYRKGQGLENFLEEKLETFLQKASSKKRNWLEKAKNPNKKEISSYYDTGDICSETEYLN